MINNIDYSAWGNAELRQLAANADKDGIKGLNRYEVIELVKSAAQNNIDIADIKELLGARFSPKTVQSNVKWQQDPLFNKAVEFYNEEMDYSERSDVTYKTYSNLGTRLYNMEKAIDQAFIECDAYQDIVIIPKKYYKFYPNFNDKLINFNVDEIRNLTSKDMDSLYELKDKIEYIMEDANGETEHNTPSKTEYDIEALAQKHLGMSYEEFVSQYAEELEFCKTVTLADMNAMTDTQRMVYRKAKAYVTEMLNTTIMEAHTTNWDAGERKTEETLKATDDMFTISEFETDGISKEGIAEIQSGIMYKAFEEELIKTYNELNPDGVQDTTIDNNLKGPKKVLIKGQFFIFMPDGSIYDATGKKIK